MIASSVALCLGLGAITIGYRAYHATSGNVNEAVPHGEAAPRNEGAVHQVNQSAISTGDYDPPIRTEMSRKDGKTVTTITRRSGAVEVTTENDLIRPAEIPVAAPTVADIDPVNVFPQNRAMTSEDLLRKCGGSVALVRGLRAASSGYLIRPQLLAIPASVLDMDFVEDIEVFFPSAPDGAQGPLSAQLAAYDRDQDLAILVVTSSLAPFLTSAADAARQPTGAATVIGNPTSVDFSKVFIEANPNKSAPVASAENHGAIGERRPPGWNDQIAYALRITPRPTMNGGVVLDERGRTLGMLRIGRNGVGLDQVPALSSLVESIGSKTRPFARSPSSQRAYATLRLAALAASLDSVSLEVHRRATDPTAKPVDLPMPIGEFDARIEALSGRIHTRLMQQAGQVNADRGVEGDRYTVFALAQDCDQFARHRKKPIDGLGYHATSLRLRRKIRAEVAQLCTAWRIELPQYITDGLQDDPQILLGITLPRT